MGSKLESEPHAQQFAQKRVRPRVVRAHLPQQRVEIVTTRIKVRKLLLDLAISGSA